MKHVKIEIGEKIRLIRNTLGLSQFEFGEKLSLHQVTIGRYENGERMPSIETLGEIAKLDGKSVEWFFETDYNKDLKQIMIENNLILKEILEQMQILNAKVR